MGVGEGEGETEGVREGGVEVGLSVAPWDFVALGVREAVCVGVMEGEGDFQLDILAAS